MKNNNMLKIAVLSISLLTLAPNAVSVAIADMTQAFSGSDPGTIALILTLPSLTMIPFTLLSGFLSNLMSKKLLVIGGTVLFIVSGMAPLGYQELNFILITRALLGAGLGILAPFTTGLIADFFDGDEKNGLLGFQSATVNIGMIVTSLIAGFLAVVSWKQVFWVYAIGIIALLLVLFKLPQPARPQNEGGQKMAINKVVYLFCFFGFAMALFQFPLFTTTSLLVASQNMGNAASVGMVLTISTVAGLFTGLVFGKIFGLAKKYVSTLGLLVLVIGFSLISYSVNIGMVYAGSAFIGTGMSLLMPFLIVKISMVTDKATTTFVIGLFMCSVYLGQFISPIALMNITRLLGNTTERFTFLLSGIVFLAATVIFTLVNILTPSSQSTKGEKGKEQIHENKC